MLDIFRGLKSLLRVSNIHIDSPVFRLHYSITVSILIAFSLIVTTRQYVGNPIDCIHTKEIPEDVFNTFCWIHSTFTVSVNKQEPYAKMYLPGIRTTHDEKEKKVYKYYQWVSFCLFFQVSCFFVCTCCRSRRKEAFNRFKVINWLRVVYQTRTGFCGY